MKKLDKYGEIALNVMLVLMGLTFIGAAIGTMLVLSGLLTSNC